MRQFNGLLFMGAGESSLAHVGHLYTRLGRAIDTLGGIQQPDCIHEAPDPKDDENRADGEREVEMIAKEIYTALTGRVVVQDKPLK